MTHAFLRPEPPSAAARFRMAADLTIMLEGGGKIVDDPGDPGGLTKWGIAQRWHPDVDVRNLTREGAVTLLRTGYWDPVRGDLLPWPAAAAVFDHAVHSGPGDAAKALQWAVGVKQDGIIGEATRGEARVADPARLLARLAEARIRELIAEDRPASLVGWMIRIARLALECGRTLDLPWV